MANWEATSRPAHASGSAHWDAVNILMNTIDATSIAEPRNFRTPIMPVSYPSIWFSTDANWLLWNASIQNSTVRAVGEVIIVFGRAKITKGANGYEYETSADIRALNKMYYDVKKLKPPAWPETIFDKLDQTKVELGAKIYEREKCAECHANRPPYPMTEPDEYGHRYLQISKTPITAVKTDPTYAEYFVKRTAVPGIFADALKETAVGGQEVIPASLLFLDALTRIAVAEVEAIAKDPQEREKLLGCRPVPELPKTEAELAALVDSLLAYKAAPLAGIWASAPYLHNAAVPTLYHLLLPAAERPKTFYLGNPEFDPKHVGYQTEPFAGGTLYNTALPGYSNQGHEYGTQLHDEERWALVEYLKSL